MMGMRVKLKDGVMMPGGFERIPSLCRDEIVLLGSLCTEVLTTTISFVLLVILEFSLLLFLMLAVTFKTTPPSVEVG